MKKRFLLILSILMIVLSVIGLTACGESIQLKLNFVVDDEIIKTIETSGNETIIMPDNPEKEGYVFDGWYWDKGTWQKPFTTNSLLDAPLSSGMCVYAKFNKNHTHEYTEEVIAPTCTAQGYTRHTCECGDSYIDNYTNAKGHSYTEEVIAPTCTAQGYTRHTCECGDSYIDNYTNAKGHSYTEEVIAPTCTAQGYTKHTCECGDSYIDNYTNAKGHKSSDWIIDNEATYESKGSKHKECTICKKVLESAEIPVLVANGINFKTIDVDKTNNDLFTGYVKVSNTQEVFNFKNEITASGIATYTVSKDIYGVNTIVTKIVPLDIGDNTFYVLEVIGEDITTYKITIRRKPMYTVAFNSNGGASVNSQSVEEDSFVAEPTTTRTGYTFDKWDYDFETAITQDKIITASWTANNYTLTINYYYADTTDKIADTHTSQVAYDSEYSVNSPVKTGYTVDNATISGTMNNINGLTFSVYYTANEYTLTINYYYVDTTTKVFDTYISQVAYDSDFSVDSPLKAGYSIDNAIVTGTMDNINGLEFNVYYTANNYTLTINYYYKDTTNKAFETYTSQVAFDSEFSVDSQAKAGYTANNLTIAGTMDNTNGLDFNVYYTANNYTLTINYYYKDTTNKAFDIYTSQVAFDSEFSVDSQAKAGYTANNLTVSGTMDDTNGKTFNVYYTANTDTKYKVEYYLQNVENDEYTLLETENLTGTTDTTANAEQKNYEHFTFNSTASTMSGNIAGDESLVLKAYYTKDKYCVTLQNDTSSAGSLSGGGAYKYGKKITITATDNGYLGYTWKGWYDGDNLITENLTFEVTVEKVVTYKAVWEIDSALANFYFSSTATACTITGVKDNTISSITIPDYVTSIGEWAFDNCTSLTSITIPNSVTSIGGEAFSGCYKLVEVINLSSLTITEGSSDNGDVGYYALNIKTSGESDIVNEGGYLFYTYNNVNYLLGYVGNETELTLPENYNGQNYKINQYAFYKNAKITKVTIPDSVTSIVSSVFENCSSLTSIEIPNSVTSIGDYAFSGCRSLTSITIPNSVEDIGDYAFYYCSSLTSITIPSSVTSIGYRTFDRCYGLQSVTIGNSVTSIEGCAFEYCTSLTSITIPNSVTSIGGEAFSGCYKLVEIINLSGLTITKGSSNYGYVGYYALNVKASGESDIKKQGDYLFYTYNNVNYLLGYVGNETELTLPANYNGQNYEFYKYAFYKNANITKVTIPYSVTSVEGRAFSNCTSLTSITIPNSVTSIGSEAFSGCYKLVEIINLSSLTITKGSSNYGYVGYYALNVKASGESDIKKRGDYLFYTVNDVNYLVNYVGNETELTLPENYNGQNYKINQYAFYKNAKITKVTIPNSVTSIGWHAFSNCTSLTSIIIPDSVTSIEGCAFEYCTSLTSVIIPDSVTSIESGAFYNCSKLTSVTIGNGVTSIGSSAFYNCSKLTSVTIGNSVTSIGGYAFMFCSLTSVTIPDSVTSIGSSAFVYCSSLTSITIPDSVTSIGSSAFECCYSLTSITYNGTIEQWKTVRKENSWIIYVPSTCIVHCSDGDVAI